MFKTIKSCAFKSFVTYINVKKIEVPFKSCVFNFISLDTDGVAVFNIEIESFPEIINNYLRKNIYDIPTQISIPKFNFVYKKDDFPNLEMDNIKSIKEWFKHGKCIFGKKSITIELENMGHGEYKCDNIYLCFNENYNVLFENRVYIIFEK